MGKRKGMRTPSDTGNSITHDTPSSNARGADTPRQTDGSVIPRTAVAGGTSHERYAEARRKERRDQAYDTMLVAAIVIGYIIAIIGGAS
jgi:hypothetical protein